MEIIEINDYQNFLSLAESWSKFLKHCPHSIFSTWEWLSTWWKYFGKNKKLLILLAKENNKIIGIAPLMYSVHSLSALRRGKIEFIGTPDTDYNNFLIAEKRNDCLNLFFNHLYNIKEKWDCIDLLDIPTGSECLPFIAKTSSSMKIIRSCTYINLPKSTDVLLSTLSSNLRHLLRRNLAKLQNLNPDINLVDYSKIDPKKGMKILFRLHQKRWLQKGSAGVYAEEIMCKFHLELAKSLSEKGLLALYSLEVSGKPISVLYGYKDKNKFYAYLSGLDPAYYRFSAGNLVFFKVMSHCIEEGLKEFDFLRGSEEYKERWSANIRYNYQATYIKKGAIAKIHHSLYNEYWYQGNRLKYILKLK